MSEIIMDVIEQTNTDSNILPSPSSKIPMLTSIQVKVLAPFVFCFSIFTIVLLVGVLFLEHKLVALPDSTHNKSVTFKTIDSPFETNVKGKAFPSAAKDQSVVQPMFSSISTSRMKSFIESFSKFNNRYYTSTSGGKSSQWLHSQVQEVFEASSYTTTQVTVEAIEHFWVQNSIVARIEGSDSRLKKEIIVLGAHQDSINAINPMEGRAPGADDDASGSVTILETFRLLLGSGFVPKRTIEFHWYAAEEIGLGGSVHIAGTYHREGRKVIAMAQFDVVGYTKPNSNFNIGIITDYTDNELNTFVRTIIDSYCTGGWKNTHCGYRCSDHASWNSFGFAATFPVEYNISPYMHTARDTIDTINFGYVTEFVKLALGFTVELAEPTGY